MAKLTVEVDEDLKRRIESAATSRDETVEEFLRRAVAHELENGEEIDFYPSEGGKPRGSENPPKLERGNTLAEAVIEDREFYPSEGGKPTGLRDDAPRPKGGGNPVSDAVIEDRR